MLILVDMDGVLAYLEQGFLDIWQAKYPAEFYIPVEQRTQFYLEDEYGEQYRDRIHQIFTAPGFFRNLSPMPDSVATLSRLQAAGHDVVICTSPFSGNHTCLQEKYDWVNQYLGQKLARTMVIAKDKTMVKGDILIDDRPQVTGRFAPEWEHVLFHAPYNVNELGRRRLTCWADAVTLWCEPV